MKQKIDIIIERDYWVIALWLLLMTVFIVAVADVALGHDAKRPDLDAYFGSLRAKGGPSCCDGSEALRLEDPDWDHAGVHYRVRIEGEWYEVGDDALVEKPSPDGIARAWPYRANDLVNGKQIMRWRIRCFQPGTLG